MAVGRDEEHCGVDKIVFNMKRCLCSPHHFKCCLLQLRHWLLEAVLGGGFALKELATKLTVCDSATRHLYHGIVVFGMVMLSWADTAVLSGFKTAHGSTWRAWPLSYSFAQEHEDLICTVL